MIEKSMSSHEGDSPVVASLKSTTLKDISGRYSGEMYTDVALRDRLWPHMEENQRSSSPDESVCIVSSHSHTLCACTGQNTFLLVFLMGFKLNYNALQINTTISVA